MAANQTSQSRSGATQAHAGFSLVELMVALTIGGVALTSIYAVGAASTRHFREQARISTTQTSVRMAMETIKKDFQRAGYFGTPNAEVQPERCGGGLPPTSLTPGAYKLAAVTDFFDRVAGVDTPPAYVDSTTSQVNKPYIALDSVALVGNYTTTGEYPMRSFSTNTVRLAQDSYSFQRDFWYNGPSPPADRLLISSVTSAFALGRMVRLHAAGETFMFTTVNGPPTVSLPDVQVPVAASTAPSGCAVTTGGWIAPVNKIQYRVMEGTYSEASRLSTGGKFGILKRTEVDPTVAPDTTTGVITALNDASGSAPLDDRSVLDYVVNFNLRFVMAVKGANNRSVPNTVNWVAAPAADVHDLPHEIIGVIIDLAARTPEQEPSMSYLAGSFGTFTESGPRTFRVFTDRPGAARVRAAHAELLLPNIAYKGY
ncbi:MAG TPA: prepilin-type N-terminal cleavage/methylation domain-containing protein [Polyangiales bacterium]